MVEVLQAGLARIRPVGYRDRGTGCWAFNRELGSGQGDRVYRSPGDSRVTLITQSTLAPLLFTTRAHLSISRLT